MKVLSTVARVKTDQTAVFYLKQGRDFSVNIIPDTGPRVVMFVYQKHCSPHTVLETYYNGKRFFASLPRIYSPDWWKRLVNEFALQVVGGVS
jgi:hypothetical protein